MADPQINIAHVLQALTLAERSARNARENVVMQLEAMEAARQPQLAIAGAAVLNQIQNGDARVLNSAAQNPAAKMVRELAEAAEGEMRNLVIATERLKVALTPKAPEGPHQ